MTAEPVLDRWRFSVEAYEQMAEVGILGADARVELLDGEIVEMAPVGPRHSGAVNRLTRFMVQRAGDQAIVVVQNPLRLLPRSEPEPDLVLAVDRADFYGSAHPTAADVILVVEVSESSLRRDQLVKVPIYARERIPEVWIVDVAAERVIVYTEPAAGAYQTVRVVGRGQQLSPALLPSLAITADEILGEP